MNPIPLSADEAGVLVATAVQVLGTIEAACIHERPPLEDLPRGLLTCGQACLLASAALALALERFPELLEPGTLEEALRIAQLHDANGAIN